LGQSYDRDLTDIFAIQSELSQEIATALSAALSPREKALLENRPTTSLAAYDLYVKARANIFADSNDLSRAQCEQLLLEAIKLDAAFAQAWALLCYAHVTAVFTEEDHSPERLAKAKAAIRPLCASRPATPWSSSSKAAIIITLPHYARAAEHYQRLLVVRPTPSAFTQMGFLYRGKAAGRGVGQPAQSAQLDPRSVNISGNTAETLQVLRRYGEAAVEARHAVELARAICYRSQSPPAAVLRQG